MKAKEAKEKYIASVHTQNHIKLMRNISSKEYDSRRNRTAKKFNSIYFNEGSSESAGCVIVIFVGNSNELPIFVGMLIHFRFGEKWALLGK